MRPKNSKNKAVSVGDLVQGFMTRLEKEKKFSKEDIDEVWKAVVGDAAFKHSRPSALRKKALIVRLDSSAWMQELEMQKRKFLKALQRALGKDKISEIHFKIGEF